MTNSSGAFTVAANPSLSLAGRTVVTGASSGTGAAGGRRGDRGPAGPPRGAAGGTGRAAPSHGSVEVLPVAVDVTDAVAFAAPPRVNIAGLITVPASQG